MAMGALCAADEMGLRVPQDVSLIGYDNVRNARYFTPALTTIHERKTRWVNSVQHAVGSYRQQT